MTGAGGWFIVLPTRHEILMFGLVSDIVASSFHVVPCLKSLVPAFWDVIPQGGFHGVDSEYEYGGMGAPFLMIYITPHHHQPFF